MIIDNDDNSVRLIDDAMRVMINTVRCNDYIAMMAMNELSMTWIDRPRTMMIKNDDHRLLTWTHAQRILQQTRRPIEIHAMIISNNNEWWDRYSTQHSQSAECTANTRHFARSFCSFLLVLCISGTMISACIIYQSSPYYLHLVIVIDIRQYLKALVFVIN